MPDYRRNPREVAAGLRVVKLGYSLKPWRLVNSEGRELWGWEEYPGGGGLPAIQMPVCFARKRDAIAALADIQRRALEEAS